MFLKGYMLLFISTGKWIVFFKSFISSGDIYLWSDTKTLSNPEQKYQLSIEKVKKDRSNNK